MNLTGGPTLHLFAGYNGAGKTTFAKAYLRQLDPIPRLAIHSLFACQGGLMGSMV